MTLPRMPTRRLPTSTPAIESSPPRMVTAMAGKSSVERVQSTPWTEPQSVAAATAAMPARPQEMPMARSTEMPTAQLETWSSETARSFVPSGVRKKSSAPPIIRSATMPPIR